MKPCESPAWRRSSLKLRARDEPTIFRNEARCFSFPGLARARAAGASSPRRTGGLVSGTPAPEGALRCHDAAQRLSHRPLGQENRADPSTPATRD